LSILTFQKKKKKTGEWLNVTRELRVANQTSKEIMLCSVDMEDGDGPETPATVEFVILLRWMLRHEERGKERQPHRKLQKKLSKLKPKGKK